MTEMLKKNSSRIISHKELILHYDGGEQIKMHFCLQGFSL